MSDLREKLLKAGLITEAQVTRVEAEARPTPDAPRGGRGEGGGGGGRRRRGRGGRRGEGPGEQPDDAASRGEVTGDASQVAESGRVEVKGRATRRWYYVSREGLVPFVEVPDEAGAQLDRGDLALVESPEGATWLVSREAASRLARLDRDWLRAFNA